MLWHALQSDWLFTHKTTLLKFHPLILVLYQSRLGHHSLPSLQKRCACVYIGGNRIMSPAALATRSTTHIKSAGYNDLYTSLIHIQKSVCTSSKVVHTVASSPGSPPHAMLMRDLYLKPQGQRSCINRSSRGPGKETTHVDVSIILNMHEYVCASAHNPIKKMNFSLYIWNNLQCCFGDLWLIFVLDQWRRLHYIAAFWTKCC